MKASVFVGASVDGFIARADGGLDWLPEDCEDHGYNEFMATVDALVMGRNTFEIVLAFGGWAYGDKPVFVLSNRPLPPVPDGAIVERLSGAPTEIMSALAARGVGHVYVDGGIVIQSFLREGLVQRLIVTRIPVLLGEGIPLFGALSGDVRLKHVATRSFPSGLVQSEYRLGSEDSPGSRSSEAKSRA
ncbi:MAG: dihydrofolate reductase family protein [Amphiplicatus sp.]